MDGDSTQLSIQSQINRLKNLPVLPEASVRILEAINDPDVSIDSLSQVLALSPDLTARLLGLANSAYFGQARTVNDIRTAIFQVLGLQLVKSLALGIVLNVQFDSSKCKSFDTEYFWMRSLLTALTAQKLAQESPRREQLDAATAYTGGLLLNIGVLVMAYLAPESLNDVLVRCEREHLVVHEQIETVMGFSHFHVGHSLLQKWHLPEVFQAILANFEDKTYQDEHSALLNILRISQRISSVVVSNHAKDRAELIKLAPLIGMSEERLDEVIEKLVESKEGIQQLAVAMG